MIHIDIGWIWDVIYDSMEEIGGTVKFFGGKKRLNINGQFYILFECDKKSLIFFNKSFIFLLG